MTVELQFKAENEFIVVKASGTWTRRTGRQIIDFGREQAESAALKLILFDCTHLSLPDNMLTRFDTGEYIAQTLHGFLVAAVGGRPEMVNHFAETVAQNRGGQRMAFVHEAAALEWLLGHSPNP